MRKHILKITFVAVFVIGWVVLSSVYISTSSATLTFTSSTISSDGTLNVPGISSLATTTISSLTTKNQNGIRYADQFCNTPGVLDESCINNAIEDFGSGHACGTVILPLGEVDISNTIGGSSVIGGRQGCNFIGQGAPQGTSGKGTYIKWVGSSGGTMFQVAGCLNCYSEHFTLDGNSSAGIGFAQTIGGGSTSQQNYAGDIVVENVTGSPGYSLYVGDASNNQVSESTFDKFLIQNAVDAVYQEGTNTNNIHYNGFSVVTMTHSCFNIQAGGVHLLQDSCVDITGAGVGTYYFANSAGSGEVVDGYDEHSSAVPSFYMPGVINTNGNDINITGGAYNTSVNGQHAIDDTQNGTLNLQGVSFGGSNAIINFDPIGTSGNGHIGVLEGGGNNLGSTVITPSGSYYAVLLQDTGINTDYSLGLSASAVGGLHRTYFTQTNVQLYNSPLTQYDGTTRWDVYPNSGALSWYKSSTLAGGWDTGTANASREWDAKQLGLKTTVTTYNNLTTAGLGVPAVYAAVATTGATTSISTTALKCGAATCASGVYRASLYMVATTPGAAATVVATIGWRDGADGTFLQTATSSALDASTSTTYVQQQFTFRSNGGTDIQYFTTLTNSATYSIYINLERLQ